MYINVLNIIIFSEKKYITFTNEFRLQIDKHTLKILYDIYSKLILGKTSLEDGR